LNTCSELVAGLVAAVDPAGEGWEVLFTDELHPITTGLTQNKLTSAIGRGKVGLAHPTYRVCA